MAFRSSDPKNVFINFNEQKNRAFVELIQMRTEIWLRLEYIIITLNNNYVFMGRSFRNSPSTTIIQFQMMFKSLFDSQLS